MTKDRLTQRAEHRTIMKCKEPNNEQYCCAKSRTTNDLVALIDEHQTIVLNKEPNNERYCYTKIRIPNEGKQNWISLIDVAVERTQL